MRTFRNRSFRPYRRKARPFPPKGKANRLSKLFGAIVAVCVMRLALLDPIVGASYALAGCHVKGNISPNTGERIFHIPGQSYYSRTHITLIKGERWFCSEQAAREAGWRKSYQ